MLFGVAVPRGAPNARGAQSVALETGDRCYQTFLIGATHMPSTRRDVEADASADAYLSTFRAAALNSFSFADPDPVQSDAILGRMIDAVTSGRADLSDAVHSADDELQALLRMQ